MKNKGLIIFIAIILILAVAFYLFKDKIMALFKGASLTPIPHGETNLPPQLLCSDGITPKAPNTVCPTKCADGTFQQDPNNCPLQKGDLVYLNPNAAYSQCGNLNGLGVYTFPRADSQGTYLVGITRQDWYPGQAIGKLVDVTGTGWGRITLNNLQVWVFIAGQGCTQTTKNLTGDYFMKLDAIQKSPY